MRNNSRRTRYDEPGLQTDPLLNAGGRRRESGIAFDIENPTDEQMRDIDRAIAVFKRGAPVVYVNGLAMSNPSTEQTIAAYRGSGGRR